jgi:hypothetical protein
MTKYALHPGWVTSKSDGDRHWISGAQLARLYQLHPDEYIIWDDSRGHQDSTLYAHLYPSFHGNYGRPNL